MYRSRLVSALAMAALATILLPSSLHAQITFERTYGGEISDAGESVRQTGDGGYIIAGHTGSFGAGGHDIYLIKTDAGGDTLWTRTYGGRDDQVGYSVRQTFDGGYIVAGQTGYFAMGNVYLVRTDPRGDTLWTRTFGGAAEDIGYSVQQTVDGGYVIAGLTVSFGAGGSDVYVIKTDTSGDTMWTRTYGGPGDDWGRSVQQTADGGYILAGVAYSLGTGSKDVCLIKTDPSGDTLWTRTFGGAHDDWGYSVGQTTDSGYIIAGLASASLGWPDLCLIKTDASGEALWTRTYGGTNDDRGYSVQQTIDGGYVVVGYAVFSGARTFDVYLVKTDADGDTLWTRTYGGVTEDFGYCVQQTVDRGYIITGEASSFGPYDPDVYLVKTDSLGDVAVAEPKASPTRAPALSLSCEPNPFRTRTAISLQLTADSPAELAIFDASGRRVRTYTVNRTPYTVWDGKDDFGKPLPSGAYFVRVDAGNEHAAARLVLQR